MSINIPNFNFYWRSKLCDVRHTFEGFVPIDIPEMKHEYTPHSLTQGPSALDN